VPPQETPPYLPDRHVVDAVRACDVAAAPSVKADRAHVGFRQLRFVVVRTRMSRRFSVGIAKRRGLNVNLRPVSPELDVANSNIRHSVIHSDPPQRSRIAQDRAHLFLGELRLRMRRAAMDRRLRPAPLRPHVRHVLSVRPEPVVPIVATDTVVARMADFHLRRDGTMPEFVRVPRRVKHSNLPVAARNDEFPAPRFRVVRIRFDLPYPRPAIVGSSDVDLRPEPRVFGCFSRLPHDRNLAAVCACCKFRPVLEE
jgi:hypothetical protein